MEVLAIFIIITLIFGIQNFLFNLLGNKRLEYKCQFSVPEAHEGDEIFLVETVYNKKPFPVPWLKVDIHSSRWLDFAGTKSVIIQDKRVVTSSYILKSFQKTTRKWKLKCNKRGVFRTENVTLVWGDILGVGNTSDARRVDANLIVYPEIIDIDNIFMPINFLQGDNLVKRWIIDDPFIMAGVREYTSGDPLNRIQWKATAKEGKLMVKKNDFTSQLSLTVILNVQSVEFEHSHVVFKDRIEFGIKVAASLLDRGLEIGAPVRLAVNGCGTDNVLNQNDSHKTVFSDIASGRDHVAGLLMELSALELKNTRDFEHFLEDHSDDMDTNDIIIISSYLNESMFEFARTMCRRGNQAKIVLLDRPKENVEFPGDLDIFVMREESY